MDGCSRMANGTHMYHHQRHGLETSPSISLTFNPIHEDLYNKENNQEITITNSQALIGPGISLGSPLSRHIFQSQPVDQQSLECLFLGNKNSNFKKRSNIESIQDDQNHDQFDKRRKINNTNNYNDIDNFNNFGPGWPIGPSNINFQQSISSGSFIKEPDADALEQMKEMIYRASSFRLVDLTAEVVEEKPKKKNMRISSEPQTVAARKRRERISERLRVLQKLVPGGSKMDIASMLDEAANYLKFLRKQVQALEVLGNSKVNDYIYPPNYRSSSNHLFCPINLEFSSLMTFPMQTISASPYLM